MADYWDYMRRWIMTKAGNLLGNIVMTTIIMVITCFAVRKDVFDLYEPTKACLFAVLMCAIWSGLFNSIALFYSERDYLPDDLSKFLRVRTYVAVNFTIQFILCLAEAALSAIIFSLFFDYSSRGLFLGNSTADLTATFFLIMLSMDMLGLLVGMLIDSITSIMTVIPVILIAQMLLSGCLFELNVLLEKIAVITTAHWGFYAFAAIADLNRLLPDGLKKDVYQHDARYVLYCWIFLILLTFICTFVSGILLYVKVNRKDS